MIENALYLSPLWLLVLGVAALFVCYIREAAVGTVFRLAKIFTIMSFGCSVIFYNRTAFADFLQADKFTLLFEIILFAAICATLFLSRKWYASMNVGCALWGCGLLASGLAGLLLIMSKNLGLTWAAFVLMAAANYLQFIRADKRKDIYISSRLYAFSAVFVLGLFSGCVLFLYMQTNDLNYDILGGYFENGAAEIKTFLAATVLILAFVFFLGLAPLHFWYTETTGQIVLPVFTYFTLVPIGACWAAFIKMNTQVLSSVEPRLTLFCQGLAILSLFVGSVGACSGKNIRKIFAYSSVCQQGIIFLVLQRLTADALNTAFIYLAVYLLAMYGVCACLFGLKNKGEYLFMLSDFEGASFRRPYISAMLTFFLFSLIGFPPFLGFLGVFAVVSDLVFHNNFYQLSIVLAAFLVLVYAYLQIVRTLYFENSNIAFDRADRGIYTAIFGVALLMVILTLQPHFLIQDFELIFEGALAWR